MTRNSECCLEDVFTAVRYVESPDSYLQNYMVYDLQVRLSTLSNRSRTRCGLIDCLRACQLLVSSRIGYPVPCIALLPVFLGSSLAFPLDFCLDLDFSSPLLSIGLLRLGLGLGLPPLHPLHLPLRNLT